MAKKQNGQMKIEYVKEKDMYQLLVRYSPTEEWGFCCGSVCQRCEHDKPDAEPMFVSAMFIEEIRKGINLGYEMVR